jgi:hypothetical protein
MLQFAPFISLKKDIYPKIPLTQLNNGDQTLDEVFDLLF